MNFFKIVAVAIISMVFALSANAELTKDDVSYYKKQLEQKLPGATDDEIESHIYAIETIYNIKDTEAAETIALLYIDQQNQKKKTRNLNDTVKFLSKFTNLKIRYENFKYDNTYANGNSFTDSIERTKGQLDFGGQFDDNIYAKIRLEAYNEHGSGERTAMSSVSSQKAQTPAKSRDVEMTRAFIQVTLNPDGDYKVSVFAGDLTSQNGPSLNVKNGEVIDGSYDALGFNGNGSGKGLKITMDPIAQGLIFKVVNGIGNKAGYINPATDMGGFYGVETNMEDTKITGGFLEYINGDRFAQFYVLSAKDLNINPSLGAYDINAADMSAFGIALQQRNINLGNNIKLDVFAHYYENTVKPNGKTVDLSGSFGPAYSSVGFLSSGGDTSEKKGDAVWLGSKFTYNAFSFGYEYLKTSKNYFAFNSGADVIRANMFDNIGTTNHFYAQYKIPNNILKNALLTFSHYNIEATHTNGHVGARMEINPMFGNMTYKERTASSVDLVVSFGGIDSIFE